MKSKILFTTLISALLAGVLAADQGTRSGPGDRRPPSPEKMLEYFDANGDGVIELGEIEARQELRQEKRQEWKERIERIGQNEQSKEKGNNEARPGRDPAKMAVFIVEKFDSDGDGQLSVEEVEAFLVQKQNQMRDSGPNRPKGPPAKGE